jgi:hypothetical protein
VGVLAANGQEGTLVGVANILHTYHHGAACTTTDLLKKKSDCTVIIGGLYDMQAILH